MRKVLLALVALVPVAACSSRAAVAPSTTVLPATRTASPFVLDPVPAELHVVGLGRGTSVQSWGDDSTGTTEPVTVVEQAGTRHRVLVSVTGYEGYQGKLDQASTCYLGRGARTTTLGGRRAIECSVRPDRQHEVLVDRGNDLAVRVVSPDGKVPMDNLRVLASHAVPAKDHGTAPAVRPLSGWTRLGHLDVGLVLAARSNLRPASNLQPGPPSAWTASYAGAVWPGSALVVETLPGAVADPPAVAAALGTVFGEYTPGTRPVVSKVTVDGRPATVALLTPTADCPQCPPAAVLVGPSSWGDLLVLHGAGEFADPQRLADVARHVRRADLAGWERVAGGPGLQPDPARHELRRGEVAGTHWLLQDRDSADPFQQLGSPFFLAGRTVDVCLKVTGGRVCAGGSSTLGLPGGHPSDAATRAAVAEPGQRLEFGGGTFPPFVVVMTETPAAGFRLTGSPEVHPLAPIPGPDGRFAGVAVGVKSSGLPPVRPCGPVPVPAGTHVVELVDGAGRVVTC